MFDIMKAGRGIKRFMNEKINTCKELLSSSQNRLVIGLVLVGAGVGFVASAYMHVPKEQRIYEKSIIICQEQINSGNYYYGNWNRCWWWIDNFRLCAYTKKEAEMLMESVTVPGGDVIQVPYKEDKLLRTKNT